MISKMANKKARTWSPVNRSVQHAMEGKIFFDKIIRATGVSKYLNLPIAFVRQHSDKIQISVTLQNAVDKKRWTVRICLVYKPRLLAAFHGGWKAFAVANDLVEGDRVTFVLVAMSMFEVHILRGCGVHSKGDELPFVQMPTQRSQDSVSSRRKPNLKPVEHQRTGDVTADIGRSAIKSEIALYGFSVKKETGEENHAVDSTPRVTDSSHMPSDMDSHFFEPMVQGHEQDCRSKRLNETDICLDQRQDELPNFLKRLAVNKTGSNNRMEIPSSFLRTHCTRIGIRLKLQGIHEGSPVQDVTCTFCDRPPRLFLRGGWSKFVNDNHLRIGQRLIFIHVADSFFAVRNI